MWLLLVGFTAVMPLAYGCEGVEYPAEDVSKLHRSFRDKFKFEGKKLFSFVSMVSHVVLHPCMLPAVLVIRFVFSQLIEGLQLPTRQSTLALPPSCSSAYVRTI